MKTKRRHELHTNFLADWIGKHGAKVKPYLGWVAVGIVGALLATVVVAWWGNHSEEEMATNWNELRTEVNSAFGASGRGDDTGFQDAIAKISKRVKDFPDTPVATFGEAWMGDVFLQRGQMLVRTNRAAAIESFKKAINHYSEAASSATDPLVKNRVLLNKASAYEWIAQLDDARKTYDAIGSVYKPDAQQALAALDSVGGAKFYEQLQQAESLPPPKEAPRPGEQFGNPDEDLLNRFPAPSAPSKTPGSDAAPASGKDAAPEKTPPGDKSPKSMTDKVAPEKNDVEKKDAEKKDTERPSPTEPKKDSSEKATPDKAAPPKKEAPKDSAKPVETKKPSGTK
ncbi:MAG: hypothetical protein K8T25_16445 [Planctomycetia bacterium]|nr:hypothetical protein [Planctomycetia bacterium]